MKLLLLLAAPVGGLQGPGALRAYRGDPFAVASVSRGSALAMQAGDGGGAAESKRFAFLRPLRTASTSVAAAVFLALVGPRGAARAAESLEAPTHSATTNSRLLDRAPPSLTFSGERGQLSVRTLSPRRGTIEQLEEDMAQLRPSPEAGKLPTDMSDLLGRDAHQQYTNNGFLFDEELTELTPLQEELDELAEYEGANDGIAKFKGVFAAAGTGAVMYAALRVLQAAEKTFITNQKKEMQEEMDLTGMFIAIDAGEVEGAIDPRTGKNITVGGSEKLPKAGEPAADVAPTAAGTEAAKSEAPWLLRVLGLDNAASADDDSFWDDKVAPPTQPTAPSGDNKDDAQEPEDVDDDTDGIDELEDLLG